MSRGCRYYVEYFSGDSEQTAQRRPWDSTVGHSGQAEQAYANKLENYTIVEVLTSAGYIFVSKQQPTSQKYTYIRHSV